MLNGVAKSFAICWVNVITIVLAEKSHLLVYMIMDVIMLKFRSLDVLSHRECNFLCICFVVSESLLSIKIIGQRGNFTNYGS